MIVLLSVALGVGEAVLLIACISVVIGVVVSAVVRKKRGKTSCDCDCEHCSACAHCNSTKNTSK